MQLLLFITKIFILVGFLFFSQSLCPALDASDDGTGKIYYSIHLASFSNFTNANAYVNKLQKKGDIVFWREVDVPGKGLFYRIYLGRYRDKEEAVKFWEELKKNGSVSYRGIHRFEEKVEPLETEAALPGSEAKQTEFVASLPVLNKHRFVDNEDGTVTDTLKNLMWVKNGWRMDFMSAVTWQDAIEKCRNFREGGYKNWRLPTIEEWKSVIDKTKEYPALIEPNPFVNIIAHMPYWSGTEFSYGEKHTFKKVCPVHAYTVMLYFGRIKHQNKNKRAFIMPVRSVD